jgi:hypothetical protein
MPRQVFLDSDAARRAPLQRGREGLMYRQIGGGSNVFPSRAVDYSTNCKVAASHLAWQR